VTECRGGNGRHRLPNFAPEGTKKLRFRLWDELSALRKRPDLLASIIGQEGKGFIIE